jgi:hypothetical protein
MVGSWNPGARVVVPVVVVGAGAVVVTPSCGEAGSVVVGTGVVVDRNVVVVGA